MANQLGYNPPITKNGYDLLETLSAIQKSIRRCEEYEAVHWAVELETLNPKALWNRLKVIASEDIGLVDPLAAILIDVLEKNYYETLNKKGNPNRLFLVQAVLYLAKMPKSRIVDNLVNVVYNDERRLEIPDYAIDMHTHRGRKMGRGLKHFFAEGAKLAKQAFEDPYEKEAFEILMKKQKKKT